MLSRRVFLKNGGLALLSLGFAPRFLARTVAAARIGAPQGADHDLPARRSRRPQHDRAVRRARLLRGAAEHRHPAARRRTGGAVDLDGFFGLHPRLAPLKPLCDAKQLAIVHASRIARRHALALRRAGLHGDGDARREEHAGRLAESLPARARARRRRRRSAPSRSRRSCRGRCRASSRRWPSARSASSASAPGRPPRWSRRRSNRIRGGRDKRPQPDRRRGVRRGEDAEDRADPAKYRRPTAPTTRARGYGEALRQIAQLIKADVGLEVAFAEAGGWDHARQPGAASRPARRAARRLRPRHRRARRAISATAWPTS